MVGSRVSIVALVACLGAVSGCAGDPGERPAATYADATVQTTATIPTGSVKVVAVGDIACPPGMAVTATACRQRATAALAQRVSPRVVLALGDLQYNSGRLADFRASYDASWGALKSITRPLPGNHEYVTPGASGYYSYFGRHAPGYYVTRVGSWRVYMLNSNCAQIDCVRERSWLRNDLIAHPRACSAIAMHHPRYSSGDEHGSDPSLAPFWRIAYAHHVDLALAGHDHDYERFYRMDGDGHRRADGLLSFVSGTGGRSLYGLGTRAPGSAYFQSTDFGVLTLWLGKGAFAWKYRTIGGDVRDAGNSSCH
jgi:hypothetical protein